MAYIDGFVVAVPAANKADYLKHATDAVPVFRDHGLVRLVEAWGDAVPEGKVTDFRRAVKAREGEVIVFSWMEYADRAARDAAGEKIMADPRLKAMSETVPFDGARMIYGGFDIILDQGPGGKPGYIDGSLIAVPTDKVDAYREMTARLGAVILEHGATRVVDAWGDDLPDGKITDFKGAVNAVAGETVVYSWIEWPSKAVRDAGWPRMMADPRMHPDKATVPYDLTRMIHGGFEPILEA